MTRTVFQTRVSVHQLERWKRCAPGSVSAWVKSLVDEECDRVEAVQADLDHVRQERIEQLEAVAPGLQRAAAMGGPKPFRSDFKK